MLNILTLLFFNIFVFGQEFTESQRQFIKAENLLRNPGGENGRTDWTLTAGVLASDSTILVSGKRSLKVTLSSQALSLHQDSTLYQSQFADGIQGLASVRVKTSVAGLRVCSRQNAVITSNLCVDVQANQKWGLYKVPFTLGGTSNGISINSNSVAVTGDVYIDDAFVGAVDLQATVDQSRVAGESNFASTAGCNPTRTSTTVGALGAIAACPGPTITRSSIGDWQTTDSNLFRQTINNLPAGTYKATFIAWGGMTIAGRPTFAINDGTTTCTGVNGPENTASYGPVVVQCTFSYNSSANRSFELFAGSSSGTVQIANDGTTTPASVKFILEYFGSGTTYSSTNADTDWVACNFSTLAWNGLGTVSSVESFCKRQGSDLLFRGRATLGTITAAEARIPLPLWNGAQLSVNNSSIPASAAFVVGRLASSDSGTANNDLALTTKNNYSYLTMSYYNVNTTNPTSENLGNALFTNSNIVNFEARIPITGWQNSNIIIGQFNGLESCANTLECTDTYSANVSSAGVVSSENIDWITGNCAYSASLFTCDFKTSLFTVAPNCSVSIASSFPEQRSAQINALTSTQAKVYTIGATTSQALPFTIICQKQGVDYIGKTAKAVASDQNISTPGVLKSIRFGASISSAGVLTNNEGGKISSASCSTGNWTVNLSGLSTAPTRCFIQMVGGGFNFAAPRNLSKGISSVTFLTSDTAGTGRCVDIDFECAGVNQ